MINCLQQIMETKKQMEERMNKLDLEGLFNALWIIHVKTFRKIVTLALILIMISSAFSLFAFNNSLAFTNEDAPVILLQAEATTNNTQRLQFSNAHELVASMRVRVEFRKYIRYCSMAATSTTSNPLGKNT